MDQWLEFMFFACLMVVGFFLFLVIAWHYKYRDEQTAEQIEHAAATSEFDPLFIAAAAAEDRNEDRDKDQGHDHGQGTTKDRDRSLLAWRARQTRTSLRAPCGWRCLYYIIKFS